MEREQFKQKLDIHIMEGTEIIPNIKKKTKETNSSSQLAKTKNNKREMGTIKHFQKLCILLDQNIPKNKGRKKTIERILWNLFRSNTNYRIKKKYEKEKETEINTQ